MNRARAVRVLARCQELAWTGEPAPGSRGPVKRWRYLDGRLCGGWRCLMFEYGAMLFHRLPEEKRVHVAETSFGPMGAWWLRRRLADVDIMLGRSITSATASDGEVQLEVRTASGTETIRTSHVVAGTGYRVDLDRLAFIDEELRGAVRVAGTRPVLTRAFESSVAGLYFVGAASTTSFGPVTRFVAGAKFTGRTLARHFA